MGILTIAESGRETGGEPVEKTRIHVPPHKRGNPAEKTHIHVPLHKRGKADSIGTSHRAKRRGWATNTGHTPAQPHSFRTPATAS